MKILYGVQGTGNGHIARARIMAKAIQQRQDCEVDFVFSGRDSSGYFDMEVFGDYRCFTGLSFETQRGAIDQWRTFRALKPRELLRDIRELDVSNYDLLLNDFEPITAWAAQRQKLPSISISHQAAFNYSVPTQGANWLDHLITRYFAPTDIQLGVHWFHFDNPILPPFIEEQAPENSLNSHFLVYLPFEELEDIEQMLFPLSEHKFECFHPGIEADHREGHIHWRKTSKQGFREAQLHCAGVIANAGFELSSECLQLGKKLLLKPLQGQYEQLSNVAMLNELGLCQSMFSLDTNSVEEWLTAPPGEPILFPDDPNILIDWLLKKQWDDTRTICKALWKQVRFPDMTRQKLRALQG